MLFFSSNDLFLLFFSIIGVLLGYLSSDFFGMQCEAVRRNADTRIISFY
ncbi:hypothetical protein CHCC20335_0548 [Bacillus paralicheniformis]|nr:hypothetical protein CHCC20335_0548 [Bacillus paralicheniformis]TWN06237.1 hypothetical protein CHCC14566_3420 [Bacillus licheniformis]